jgi:drug/metabolite transporter (DMT)-like permease
MWMGIVYALAAGAAFAGGVAFVAAITRRRLPLLTFFAVGSSLGCGLSLLVLVDWSRWHEASRSPALAWWIGTGSALSLLGHRFLSQSMRLGRPSLSWAISQGAQAFPFLAGFLLWQDAVGIVAWLGLFILLGGVAMLGVARAQEGDDSANRAWVWWALAAMLSYGLNQVCFAVPSRWVGWSDLMRLRIPITLAVIAAGGWMATLHSPAGSLRRVLPLALPYGLLQILMFVLVYRGLDALGSVQLGAIFWPLACGSGIAFYALWERIRSRETLGVIHRIGITLIIIGIAGLSFR